MNNRLLVEILSDIEAVEKDEILFQEKNFNLRVQAIDNIEFHVIDRINALLVAAELAEKINLLKKRAVNVQDHLEAVNQGMFRSLRRKISKDGYKGKVLFDLMDEYLDHQLHQFLPLNSTGYDNFDIFLNGLLTDQELPTETKVRDPEMIYFQKTPARIILELIKRVEFTHQDVFFDLGSGLGQVVILVNLLSSIVSKGVEIEPAFCDFAKACAIDLNLDGVEFINSDARYTDYSLGTVFFMYTPFVGNMFQDVLLNLQGEAKKRKIKIFAYGRCTLDLARQDWLLRDHEIQYDASELVEFSSADVLLIS